MINPSFRIRAFSSLVVATTCLYAAFPAACASRQAVSSPKTPDKVQIGEGATPITTLPGLPSGAREPQVALDDRGSVYIGFGADDALYCSVSRDGGKTYDSPVKVAAAGKLSLGMRRGPRIAVAGKTVVLSAIYSQQGKGSDGELLAWRSADGGKTWQGPARVSDVPGAAREGLHGMAASPDGKSIACTWLDLRGKGTEIYLSSSRDGGATWSKNSRVYTSPDGTVCECCHPSLAFGPKGELVVMWRNWLGGARDMFLARSADNGKTFGPAQKLGAGTWPLNACPMDGGAIAIAPNGKITTVWRRDAEMFVCELGGVEKLLGRGQQGWAAATTQGVYAVWLSGRPGRLMALLPGETAARPLAMRANDPVVASAASGKGPVIVTWSEGAQTDSSIRSAVLTPPSLSP